MLYKNNYKILKNLKPICLYNSVIKTISIPVALIIAQILSVVVNKAVSGQVKNVVIYSLFMLALILISVIIQTISDILIRRKQEKNVNNCRIDFINNFLSNPLNKLFCADYGEITENLNNDINTVTDRYIKLYPDVICGILGGLGYFLFLFFQSPIVALSLLLIALIQFIPPMIVKKYMQVNYEECRNIEAKITNHIIEAVNGFKVIKLYGLKQWWQKRMSYYHKICLDTGRKTDAVAAVHRSMYRLLDNILKFGTYALMGIYAMIGYCNIDVAIQAVYLSSGMFGSFKTVFSSVPEISVTKKAEKRLSKWDIHNKDENTSFDFDDYSCDSSVILKNICYKYKDKTVIENLNYQFTPDKNYIIKGDNGAGKTTLINLIGGLILPDNGRVFIDNFDIAEKDVYPYLLIPQHDPEYNYNTYTLFNMFNKDKQNKLFAIAKRFGLTESLMKDNTIRELSGGERKKVFLTIGFALEPMWLLLDEPSNNLDNNSKEILIELLNERKRTIIISHDNSIINSENCIIKLENGRIYDENTQSSKEKKRNA